MRNSEFECVSGHHEPLNWDAVYEHLGCPAIRTAMEVGIGPFDISTLPMFKAMEPLKLVGVDPIPAYGRIASEKTGATIHSVAINNKSGFVGLIYNEGSSFMAGTESPTPMSGVPHDVPCITFDEIDDGEIDILNLDCEGAEIHVLSCMTSRPMAIGIELWPMMKATAGCTHWLEQNGYECVHSDGPMGETQLWLRKNVPEQEF